jgi:hypothetical protein
MSMSDAPAPKAEAIVECGADPVGTMPELWAHWPVVRIKAPASPRISLEA